MVGNGNDADGIALQTVDQGIGKTMEGKRPRLTHASLAQRRELLQQPKCSLNLADEVFCCGERAFADIPVNGGIGIGLSFIAKTDSRHFLRRGLLRGAGT